MRTVVFFEWKIFADDTLTKLTYEKVVEGRADSCLCESCKNYVCNRDSLFPKPVKELFDFLGIDYTKECEVTYYCKKSNGLHHYGGWFHFKGNFVGRSCVVPLPNGGYTNSLLSLTPNFRIGFRNDSALSFFEYMEDLVQIEFEADIPWLIDEPESD